MVIKKDFCQKLCFAICTYFVVIIDFCSNLNHFQCLHETSNKKRTLSRRGVNWVKLFSAQSKRKDIVTYFKFVLTTIFFDDGWLIKGHTEAAMSLKLCLQKLNTTIFKTVPRLGFFKIEEFNQSCNFCWFWWIFWNVKAICWTIKSFFLPYRVCGWLRWIFSVRTTKPVAIGGSTMKHKGRGKKKQNI